MSEKLLDEPQPSTLGVLGDIYNMLAKIADYKRMIEPQSNKKHPTTARQQGDAKNKNASTQKETLKKIFNFIEQNYRDNIALSDIASVAGFNQSYFCRFLKALQEELLWNT